MSYEIRQGSHDKAKELGLVLLPSNQKLKKIDCYCIFTGKYRFSIGDIRQKDFYQVLETDGLIEASNLRRKYRILHRYDKEYTQMVNHRVLY